MVRLGFDRQIEPKRGNMDFFEFLNESVTPFHTVQKLKEFFVKQGFVDLKASDSPLELGKSYIMSRGGALAAFRMPLSVNEKSRFRVAMAHTDFPTLKITPNPDASRAQVDTLHTEVYGSPLFTSWLDRDLGYAGKIAYEKCGTSDFGTCVETKLFRGAKLFRIPQLAVHMNRGVNQDGLKVNPQVDFNVLWKSSMGESVKFAEVLQRELADGETLLDFEAQLFDAQPANLGGLNDEWIYSGRLDNLSSCHAVAEGLTAAMPLANDVCVGCFFNNEEVGSETREGASGNFLRAVLGKIWSSFQAGEGRFAALSSVLAESFALSIDMAHAEHPNHPEKHEPNHAPVLGGGVVLKMNSQKRYASDCESSARLKMLCKKGDVPLQTFVMRSDMPCGSTVGPTVSANLGIPTVDVGEPMLSMHSIREMMAVADHESMIRLAKTLFSW